MTFGITVAFANAVSAFDDHRFPWTMIIPPVRISGLLLRSESLFIADGNSPKFIHLNDKDGVFRPKGPFVRRTQPIGLGLGPPTIVEGLKGRPFA